MTENDKKLKASLQERWPETSPDPITQAKLLTRMKKQNTRRKSFLSPMRALAGLAIMVALALILNLTLGSLSPAPAAEEIGATDAGNTRESVAVPESVDSAPSPTVQVEDTPDSLTLVGGQVAIFPQLTWQFPDALPTGPGSVPLYRQIFGPAADEAAAIEMAARLGIDGTLSSYPGEGGGTIYQVTDADHTLILLGFAGQFSYFDNFPQDTRDPLPFDQRVRAAEAFLNAAGLLTFPYRIEPDVADPYAVRFVQLLDETPLIYGLGMNPGLLEWITVSVNADGQVTSLYHSIHDFQSVQESPILSAADAWARFADSAGDTHIQYAILAQPMVWTQNGVSGTIKLTGYFTYVDGVPELYADDGLIYTVDDVPLDVPDNVIVRISGTVTSGHIAWSEIFIGGPSNSYGFSWSCGGGGGGGGGPFIGANFGGGQFAPLNLGDPPAQATQPAYNSPIQPGDAIEGVQGTIYVNTHTYPTGVQKLEALIWVPEWTAILEIEDPSGLIPLQGLPGLIWGTVDRLDESGLPVIAVDRVEAAYPGMAIQAWLGTEIVAEVDGEEVVLFTSNEGEIYVLKDSIGVGQDDLIGSPGDQIIIEGYAVPGETFGGYPVLTELGGSFADVPLDEYQLQSTRIGAWDESQGGENQAASLTGNVTIQSVELYYYAVSLGRCSPEFLTYPGSEQWLYVQPVWRFFGTFDDGRTIEILVQALPDELLR